MHSASFSGRKLSCWKLHGNGTDIATVHLDSAADMLLRLIFFYGFVTWINGENQCRFSFIAQMLSIWEGPVKKERASAQPGAAHSSGEVEEYFSCSFRMRSADCDQSLFWWLNPRYTPLCFGGLIRFFSLTITSRVSKMNAEDDSR